MKAATNILHRKQYSSEFSGCDVVIAHCDKCRKVMLRRGTVRAQFVGVDAHIDPRIFAKSFKLMTLLKRAATKFCTEINIVCRISSFFIVGRRQDVVGRKKVYN